MADQRGFFDLDECYVALSKAGDPLEQLLSVLDFEIFRCALDVALNRSDGATGDRPAFALVVRPISPTDRVRGLTVQGFGASGAFWSVGCPSRVSDP